MKEEQKKKKDIDKGRKLCHSTWCPQTGNCIHIDHNFNLKQVSEQTILFYIEGKGREGGKKLPVDDERVIEREDWFEKKRNIT